MAPCGIKFHFLHKIFNEDRKAYDQKRDAWLKSQGYTVMRIKNEALEQNPKEVLMAIREHLLRRLGF